MVREITTYPATPSLEFGANVRHFDETLDALIQDLKDTIEANDIDALAAFQIGSPLNIVVIKQENGEYLELINPRVIKREGTVTPIEKTAYFPGITAKTKRYKKIKVVYDGRDEEQIFLDADDELSIIVQRKMDYMFGSNFRARLDEEEKKLLDSKLEFGTDAITDNGCPTEFFRDKILLVFKILFVLGLVGVVVSFFLSKAHTATLGTIEAYVAIIMPIVLVCYFFYSQYESKKYKHCIPCQLGNIVGIIASSLVKLLILVALDYYFFWR